MFLSLARDVLALSHSPIILAVTLCYYMEKPHAYGMAICFAEEFPAKSQLRRRLMEGADMSSIQAP